jgi:hypothetical protein
LRLTHAQIVAGPGMVLQIFLRMSLAAL